ncbi:2-hydroxychromene-2-carboxylate isomerase [Pseudooceanicola sp.]|uniref:2-hydroxychromene-2-carboxylate isomerase n=1 Tax=Pseudooceanicola sp. TaxID=1914328 RepID=UPI0026319489|nr:2-hydroxychromene-2-carboxylate isomerase [Pseudooceanicola sp.]MDF1854460.1 2-hydroxychromene-2-carboxylate isomerase [Pseudooceanicola sp.]
MAHIDYYFFTLSPWAYLAGNRLEEMAATHGYSIAYKPVESTRVFAAGGGKPLNERPAARQAYRWQELERAQIKTGLPLTLKPAFFPTNPAPSAYAIIAAQAAGGGDIGALVQNVLSACWAEEKNIADEAVIRDCLKAAGFDPDLADSGLLTGAMAYESNTEAAIEAGVFGSPFYITDSGQRFWGQDRLDDLAAHLAGRL